MLRLHCGIIVVTLVACLGTAGAQMAPGNHVVKESVVRGRSQLSQSLDGKWTYRSYRNQPDVTVNDDAQSATKALALLFGEGVMSLSVGSDGAITGTFDMGGGFVLDLKGTRETLPGGQVIIHLSGPGRANSPTDGWEYDYVGYVTPKWSTGIGQMPAIVGTVLRAKPHGNAPAGYVASFIAVKQGG